MNQNNLVIDEKSLDTVFQEDFKFKGNIVCEKSVLIKGTMEGNIEVKEDLYISPSSKIKGTLKSKNLTLQGDFKGDIALENHFSLHQTGSFKGDISASSIEIMKGAAFNGSFHMDKKGNEEKNEF